MTRCATWPADRGARRTPGAHRPVQGSLDRRIASFDKKIERVPADLDIHVAWTTHRATRPLIQDWFAKRPRWHRHFTPTSSSWINQVERFFALLTEQQSAPTDRPPSSTASAISRDPHRSDHRRDILGAGHSASIQLLNRTLAVPILSGPVRRGRRRDVRLPQESPGARPGDPRQNIVPSANSMTCHLDRRIASFDKKIERVFRRRRIASGSPASRVSAQDRHRRHLARSSRTDVTSPPGSGSSHASIPAASAPCSSAFQSAAAST